MVPTTIPTTTGAPDSCRACAIGARTAEETRAVSIARAPIRHRVRPGSDAIRRSRACRSRAGRAWSRACARWPAPRGGVELGRIAHRGVHRLRHPRSVDDGPARAHSPPSAFAAQLGDAPRAAPPRVPATSSVRRMPESIPGARAALERLRTYSALPLVATPTPVHEMARLRAALGGGPRLLIKRDDTIPFGFGGNKVRKLAFVAAQAVAEGADALVTTGGIQSNHARVTAAVAATLGMRCVLIANGARQERPTANALLDALLGADVRYVASREGRNAAIDDATAQLAREGRRPFTIPLGASTPLGALGFARAIGEMLEQGPAPDVIVHSSSSGGTQAGLLAGCALYGLATRVVGVSPDDPVASIAGRVRDVVQGMGPLLGVDGAGLANARPIEIDDGFIGDGYGVPSDASREAQRLAAQREAIFVDNTYTAKALAGLIAAVRAGRIPADATVLFWHTGGQVGIFA